MNPKPSKALSYAAPFAVLLALISAFFLGSRHPHFPEPSIPSKTDYLEEFANTAPQVEIWISKNGLFVWGDEPARSLAELPERILRFKTEKRLRFASVSSEDLSRFSEIVQVLSDLKKGGFHSVTIVTRPKSEPDPDRY